MESGSHRENDIQRINEHVRKIAIMIRSDGGPLHGRLLRRYAQQYAAEHNITRFKASKHWLYNFQRANKIVSRKITRTKKRKSEDDDARILESIRQFQEKYGRLSQYFHRRSIWNIDQSGFQYEPANLRTLSFRGERDTVLTAQDRNKVSHSYTGQLMVSRDGHLIGPVTLCMQERGGKFGSRVQTTVDNLVRDYRNVYVLASSSGKMSSDLIQQWHRDVLAPRVRHEPHGNYSSDDESEDVQEYGRRECLWDRDDIRCQASLRHHSDDETYLDVSRPESIDLCCTNHVHCYLLTLGEVI